MESPSKALRGNKEMTNDHTNDHDSKMAGDSGGDSVPLRSERGLDHTTNSQSHASPEAGRELQRDPFEGIDFNKLHENPLLLARVTAYLQENHLHLPILTPDRKEMAAMKEEIPELYQVYVDGLQKSVDADYIQRTHPYTEPLKNVNSGRKYSLTALLAVILLAAYALYLGHAWFAGIITALDVVGLITVFANNPNVKNNQQQ